MPNILVLHCLLHFFCFSAPSFEAFEMNTYSLLTEAIVYALDNSQGKNLMHDIYPKALKC